MQFFEIHRQKKIGIVYSGSDVHLTDPLVKLFRKTFKAVGTTHRIHYRRFRSFFAYEFQRIAYLLLVKVRIYQSYL